MQDPKKNLQTLTEYNYREEEKENSVKLFRSMGVAVIIMVVGFVAAIGFFYYLNTTATDAIRIQDELEKEFQQIAPPAASSRYEYFATHKTRHALVQCTYRTSLSYQEIRDSYHRQLVQQGWKFVGIRPESADEQGLEHRTLYYHKGNVEAALEYQGPGANAGYTYAFSLSWGLNDIEDK